MAETQHDKHDNESPAHEANVVHLAGVAWFIILLSISVVFIGWLMVEMFDSLEGRQQRAEIESRPSPFAAQRPKLPPAPRLQLAPDSEEQIEKHEPPDLKTQSPLQEMAELKAKWKDHLTYYGWVDEKTGVVRIPIDEAKKLLLERGLPTRPANKQNDGKNSQADRNNQESGQANRDSKGQ
jgi:hypothetical protein